MNRGVAQLHVIYNIIDDVQTIMHIRAFRVGEHVGEPKVAQIHAKYHGMRALWGSSGSKLANTKSLNYV